MQIVLLRLSITLKLGHDFYNRSDVELIAKDLLGKYLITNFNDTLTSGMIVETEAYAGITDKASHAYNNRRTQRTEIMYKAGGIAYVYLIYGIYSLFNVVTNVEGIPHAVLIRAIEPVDGIDKMLIRRKMKEEKKNLTAGPGLLTQALAISTKHSGLSLLENFIWVEDRGMGFSNQQIICSPRVGVGYAEEDALLKRRYRLKNNPWSSTAK